MAMGARSTAVGASCGAATLSRGVVSTRSGASVNVVVVSSGAVTTTGAMSSGAATITASDATAETADGLHPATETMEATNAMVTTMVATTVLMDQAEEEGNKARHLTGGRLYISWRDTTIQRRRRFQRDAPVAGTQASARCNCLDVGQGEISLIQN
ncbi:uncharacterized protein LOC119367727 [Triticum dicoccoides]|uniref:uncharacterized protein LOC119367727 n=1 Tax=Triticum dicoccoides TaxID=85692 RepID=UPI00188FF30C|nr:uncharacterized protein LOC119367727 [Triticum dicoccoides]